MTTPLGNAGDYVGIYSGPAGAFEVRLVPGGIAIVADGQTAALDPWGDGVFRTLHPRFRQFSLMFESLDDKAIVGASWGSSGFVRSGSTWQPPAANPKLAQLAGRYVDDSPWFGTAIIVERGGRLWFGTETPLTAMSDNQFRVGEDAWSPERASFADPIDGRPQTMLFSGEKFVRHDL